MKRHAGKRKVRRSNTDYFNELTSLFESEDADLFKPKPKRHVESSPAIFKDLHTLATGDIITIERNDKQSYRYKVYYVEQLPIEEVDMRKMMRSVDPSREGLNIITCGGVFDESIDTYRDRVLVYAVREG